MTVVVPVDEELRISIPPEVCEAVTIRAGELVLVSVCDDSLVVRAVGAGLAEHAEGLGAEVWRAVGGAATWLESERRRWDLR